MSSRWKPGTDSCNFTDSSPTQFQATLQRGVHRPPQSIGITATSTESWGTSRTPCGARSIIGIAWRRSRRPYSGRLRRWTTGQSSATQPSHSRSHTPKWDFEYQAFVLATRSALDYLRRALSAYFQDKSHSYNSWPKALRAAKPKTLADVLLAVYEAQREGLVYLKQNEAGISLRDQIAHHGHVSPATINLTAKGLFLVGGGEDLAFNREIPIRSLQSIIRSRADLLLDAVNAFLVAFISEVTKLDRTAAHDQ